MTILQIILIVIIVPITILNIRFITSGRRVKSDAKAKYSRMLYILSENEEALGGEGNYTAAKYVNDAGDNFLVCRSKVKNYGAIVTEKEFFPLSPLTSSSCTIDEYKKGDKWEKIICCVSSPSLHSPLEIEIAANPHGKRMGAILLDTAVDFRDEINTGCNK